ncbi:transglycosylase domain-containing protein [Nesterenkonia populi]|uniref:transglycosylase domain-containing protein n=1 Tax=Nesterenkonia populi TaxID=1591087 RepID=UPI0011BE219F|nr:transglycosylase domain-containing protein [Nesterenkonia populi]
MAPRKSPLFDTATTVGKIMSFLGVSALCGILAAGLIFPLAATGGAAAAAGSDLLEEIPTELEEAPLSTPSVMLDAEGNEIAEFYEENRQPVDLDEISDSMQDAILAIEDERFYEHGGVDARGVGRALVHNLTRPTQQGASTITQQYVNNVLNNAVTITGEGQYTISGINEKTYGDKLREMKLAVGVEQEMTKEEILEGYLNIVLLGGRNYGVEAAAQSYWGVSASELNIQQSAVLAGMVQSPNAYNPRANPDASLYRRDTVIDTMERNGFISADEAEEARSSDLGLIEDQGETAGCINAANAPYFCDYVTKLIAEDPQFGETEEDRLNLLNRGGLRIETTLDPELQEAAEDEVYDNVEIGHSSGAVGTITTLENETGNVLAMAQSTEYHTDDDEDAGRTTMNFNTDHPYGGSSGFPVGSTLKPFVSAAWVEEGGSMDDVVEASTDHYEQGHSFDASCREGGQVQLPDEEGWQVDNVIDELDDEDTTVDFGLFYSLNTATAATAADMDLCALNDIAERSGLHHPVRDEDGEFTYPDFTRAISAIIGGIELSPMTLAEGYTAFAQDGERCENRAILSVTDAQGNEYPGQETSCHQAFDDDIAAQVNDTLINIAEDIPDDDPSYPMLGKTGTSDGGTNTWFAGSTQGLTTVSHVGTWEGHTYERYNLSDETFGGTFYDDQLYGSHLAAPMWYDYMTQVAGAYPTGDFSEAQDSPFSDRRENRYWPYSLATGPDNGGQNDDDDSDDDD